MNNIEVNMQVLFYSPVGLGVSNTDTSIPDTGASPIPETLPQKDTLPDEDIDTCDYPDPGPQPASKLTIL